MERYWFIDTFALCYSYRYLVTKRQQQKGLPMQNSQHALTLAQINALTEEQIDKKLRLALDNAIDRIDLTYEQMREVMLLIMTGKCNDARMGAMLTALRMKSESIDEITAAAAVMRELAERIEPTNPERLVDIVGTGGDGANLFNVSTASALVAATAGVKVAKHGNRSVSGKSGSSDVLAQAGVRLDLSHDETLACLEQQNLGFLFAPNHHPAMRHAMPVRRALGMRTLFNILGPLTNPAGAVNAVIGVFTPKLCLPLAKVLQELGDKHVMVVGSNDGLDEISLAAGTQVAELKDGNIEVYELMPEDVGIDSQTLIGLEVATPEQSLALIRVALSGEETHSKTVLKARDMIALNAGAAIYVGGLASNLPNGVNIAQSVIQSGDALHKMHNFAKFTQSFGK